MLLLDTHALVWLASDLRRITRKGKQALQNNAGQLFLSAISALEIALLVKRDRLTLPPGLGPLEFVERALAQHGVSEVPLNSQIAVTSAKLPDIHNDPFDRIIIATARVAMMPILTRDKTIPSYPGVTVIWR